jgi:dTDP-4-dehydrorhamnose reductase
MKIILTGSNGQLGKEIVNYVDNSKIKLYAFTHKQLDITKFDHLHSVVIAIKPNYIINTAAYTAVDKAENEKENVFAVNALGVQYLAKIAQKYNIPLLHISTDYVFDGQKKIPYLEEDKAHPLSIYGLSKLNGENFLKETWHKHIILRVSWVFSTYGSNFVKTILSLANEQTELRVIADQRGAPTYTRDIAQTLLKIIKHLHSGQLAWGTYHYAGIPTVSWYEFAQEIITEAQQLKKLMVKTVIPISTLEYPSIARRPDNSEMTCDKIVRIFGIEPNHWSLGLKKVINILL